MKGLRLLGCVSIFLMSCLTLFSSCAGRSESNTEPHLTQEQKFKVFLDSLEESGTGEFDRISAIRKYLAIKIDVGHSIDSLAYAYYNVPFHEVSPFDCLNLFEQDSLTALCGLSSHILAKLYQRAGHEAYIYSCGFDDPMAQHEFVLVRTDDALVVQDAFFNLTITDTNNMPKDFFQLIAEIKSDDFSNIRVMEDGGMTELWVASEAEMKALFDSYNVTDDFRGHSVKSAKQRDGRLKVMLERNFERATRPSLEVMKPLLKQEGLPENYLSIYLKPLHVINQAGSEEEGLKTRIELIAATTRPATP